jgi:DNA-binding beta-propeller fold protein YncE
MVVDPDRAGVDETILVGRGPNDFAFNFSSVNPDGSLDTDLDVQPIHKRAYVTDYTESTISVIDLDPGSMTENRVVARIGLPSPPVIQ